MRKLSYAVLSYEGKITVFSSPENPALHEQWMEFVFLGRQRSFSSVFVDELFINKALFDAGFAHGLTERLIFVMFNFCIINYFTTQRPFR